MDCRRFTEKLTDAALQPGEPLDAGLARHLSSCAACRREFETQQRLARAMDIGLVAAVSAEPSPSFAAGIRVRLAEEPAPRPSRVSGWIPVTAGALAVLVLMVVWFARQDGPKPVPTKQQHLAGNAVQQPGHQSAGSNIASLPPATSAPDVRLPNRKVSPGVRKAVPRQPDVIVPPGQREAVLRFYASVMSRRVDASWALNEMKPLEVAELKIPPLEAEAGKTGSPESGNSNGVQF